MTRKHELSLEARQAIRDYLKTWFVGIGVVNVGALIAIAIYFSSLVASIGNRAEQSAVNAATQRIQESEEIRAAMKSAVGDTLKAGMDLSKMQGEIEITLANVRSRAEEFSKIIDKETGTIVRVQRDAEGLRTSLESLKNDENVKTINAIATLFEDNPVALETLTKVGVQLEVWRAEMDEMEDRVMRTIAETEKGSSEMRELKRQLEALNELLSERMALS